MFSQHVTRNISAYCNGELGAEESRRFTEHIMACEKCRAKFAEIQLGVKFAEQLPSVAAPNRLWTDIEDKLDQVPTTRTERGSWFPGLTPIQVAAFAAVILTVSALGAWWLTRQRTSSNDLAAWDVQRLNGTIRIASAAVGSKGKLGVGQWLETDGNSRAQIEVGSIGQVEIDSDTRVRLLQTQPTEHRLELARGKMSARIWAPPRLFFVDTPSAVAADLGCAYTLEVDDAGASLLRVTSGWVALELKDRESMVPAGAACATRPGVGPGTPYFEDAAPDFLRSLTTIDFSNDVSARKAAFVELLNRSRARDTLTLWHLLPRVDLLERGEIYDKITSLVPPPAGLSREGVLQLDEKSLETLKLHLEESWTTQGAATKKIAEAYWQMKNVVRRVDKLK